MFLEAVSTKMVMLERSSASKTRQTIIISMKLEEIFSLVALV